MHQSSKGSPGTAVIPFPAPRPRLETVPDLEAEIDRVRTLFQTEPQGDGADHTIPQGENGGLLVPPAISHARREVNIIREERDRELRMIAEASLDPVDGMIIAKLVDEIEESPYKFAARFLQLERRVESQGVSLAQLLKLAGLV